MIKQKAFNPQMSVIARLLLFLFASTMLITGACFEFG
jgi:hypothetical protein